MKNLLFAVAISAAIAAALCAAPFGVRQSAPEALSTPESNSPAWQATRAYIACRHAAFASIYARKNRTLSEALLASAFSCLSQGGAMREAAQARWGEAKGLAYAQDIGRSLEINIARTLK